MATQENIKELSEDFKLAVEVIDLFALFILDRASQKEGFSMDKMLNTVENFSNMLEKDHVCTAIAVLVAARTLINKTVIDGEKYNSEGKLHS